MFGHVADEYDEARPSYRDELFDGREPLDGLLVLDGADDEPWLDQSCAAIEHTHASAHFVRNETSSCADQARDLTG